MTIDDANALYWEELCGTGLARSLGIVDLNAESLERFDAAYLGYYPYLAPMLDRVGLERRRVLEIGLGFGTVSQYAARRADAFCAIDIAEAPVALLRRRLEFIGRETEGVVRGSALELPWPDESFETVISIGALHHTGDLAAAIDEVWRVLRPGGRALIMVYNGHSLRRLMHLGRRWIAQAVRRGGGDPDHALRAMYDQRTDGSAPPHTDFVSAGQARFLFRRFTTVSLERRNFDDYVVAGRLVRRAWFLRGPDRILGLDLYVLATK